jgi:glyoxylase-like metal-dependent hydrolase (beta-lactamase superfamily II)
VARDFSIDLVLISHAHEDHMAGNPFFPAARLGAHSLDAPAVRSVRRLVELFGVAGTELEEPSHKFLEELFQLRDSRVDLEFAGGALFPLGSYELQAIHTPGHSAGHCCFYLPAINLLFLADLDLSSFGPFYGYQDSEIDQLLHSLEVVGKLECTIAVSGHKGVIRGREVIGGMLEQYRGKIFEREAKILRYLERERSLDQIVAEAIIYGEFPEPRAIYELMERTMIAKHLARLAAANRIAVTVRGYQAC